MRNYADDAYLHARIYAMRGRLLTLADYAAVVRERQSALLKPGDLAVERENIFSQQIAPVLAVACALDQYVPLFGAFLRQFEIHNAKILLSMAWGRKTESAWYDTGPFAVLNKELHGENMPLAELKNIIARAFPECAFKDTDSFPRMVLNLDISAASALYHASASLSMAAQKEYREIMQRRITVLAVIWPLRLKSYYHLSDERIRSYMEEFARRFGVDITSGVRVVEEELNGHLDRIRKSGAAEPSLPDIEQHLEQGYYAWIASVFHRDFHSVYCVLAYLWLLYYQIKNLFRVIDGRRFGMSDEAILNKMICDR